MSNSAALWAIALQAPLSMEFTQARSALGRPRGMGWRGRREQGSGWGAHVNPWLIHANVWQKPLQYCKVISLQLIKISGEKKILEWVAMPFFRGSSQSKDQTQVSCIAGRFFTVEPLGKPHMCERVCVCMCVYVLFQIFFPYKLLQNIEYNSLCYTVGPYCLFILYIVVYLLLLSHEVYSLLLQLS